MWARTELLCQLADAKRHIKQGDDVIERQRQIVARLSSDGHDTAQAKALLRSLEDLQKIRLHRMEGLLNALDMIPRHEGAV